MKVLHGVISSIAVLSAIGGGPEPARAAEAVSCAEAYYLCLNEASQRDGIIARTRAEVACGGDWYLCVRSRVAGA